MNVTTALPARKAVTRQPTSICIKEKEVICMKASFNVAENGAGSYRLLAMNAMS